MFSIKASFAVWGSLYYLTDSRFVIKEPESGHLSIYSTSIKTSRPWDFPKKHPEVFTKADEMGLKEKKMFIVQTFFSPASSIE
ncbi:hypothetical protein [Eisenbergiella porci]|uniref:hypothetical protein n=2 Tax=Bacillota TaxID=1239 RepID=UPI002A823501|nr:hypothetical protein [Eisenbergiella porci]